MTKETDAHVVRSLDAARGPIRMRMDALEARCQALEAKDIEQLAVLIAIREKMKQITIAMKLLAQAHPDRPRIVVPGEE